MPYHLDTPRKNRLLGAKDFFDFLRKKEDENGLVNTRLLRSGTTVIATCFREQRGSVASLFSRKVRERRSYEKDPRGGFRGDDVLRLGEEQLDDAEKVIEENGYDGHDIDEGTLRHEATLRKKLREREIGRYLAVTRDAISDDTAKLRLDFTKDLLRRFPTKYDWRGVLFSDELHFGYGKEENRHYIYRRRGKREDREYIRYLDPPEKKRKAPKKDAPDGPRNDEETKEAHYFAVVGYGYKPDLYEYTVPSNKTGKMSGKVYVELLRKCLKPLLDDGEDFTLEEDRDGAYKSKEAVEYKKEIGPKTYLNGTASPDLSVIENPVARSSKAYFRKHARYDAESIRRQAEDS
ncbi:hypothetical protein LTR17_011016 [Elasticomyces elasticus]|nr:hypothetical protein LTR17_011016 [Elasticomyces elasticus]